MNNNKTGRKSLDRLAHDRRVLEVWCEGEDGYWATLRPGYICGLTDCASLHEHTIRDMYAALRSVNAAYDPAVAGGI